MLATLHPFLDSLQMLATLRPLPLSCLTTNSSYTPPLSCLTTDARYTSPSTLFLLYYKCSLHSAALLPHYRCSLHSALHHYLTLLQMLAPLRPLPFSYFTTNACCVPLIAFLATPLTLTLLQTLAALHRSPSSLQILMAFRFYYLPVGGHYVLTLYAFVASTMAVCDLP
jgi:hypothetical protein